MEGEGPRIHIPDAHVISGDAIKPFIEDYREGKWEPSVSGGTENTPPVAQVDAASLSHMASRSSGAVRQ